MWELEDGKSLSDSRNWPIVSCGAVITTWLIGWITALPVHTRRKDKRMLTRWITATCWPADTPRSNQSLATVVMTQRRRWSGGSHREKLHLEKTKSNTIFYFLHQIEDFNLPQHSTQLCRTNWYVILDERGEGGVGVGERSCLVGKIHEFLMAEQNNFDRLCCLAPLVCLECRLLCGTLSLWSAVCQGLTTINGMCFPAYISRPPPL